jgi:cytochrome d ubiquinol oxidase subunit II
MTDFFTHIDLPLVWSAIIAGSIFLYVLLDGFDLGVGILFPFAPSKHCQDKMINSIAPFWDSNETWLVLGGGGLLAAFPLAYSILIPAFYIPVIFMIIALVFRGVAIEFRFKAREDHRYIWDYSFHFGSLVAAFTQGLMLGTFVQGIKVSGRSFGGSAFDWLTPFSIMTGVALVFGYALLGATWTIMKTDVETEKWARKTAIYLLIYVAAFMGIVSLWIPLIDERIAQKWFSLPNLFYLSIVPILTFYTIYRLIKGLLNKEHRSPFICSIILFILCYIGLAVSIWPWIVPYNVTIWQAAASHDSQVLLLIGTAATLPVVLIYTGYCYYVFRGKVSHKSLY